MMDFKNIENEWKARERHTKEVGFVRPNEDLCKFLASFGPWVEIGAGSGALAQGIRAAGGAIVATDNFSWHSDAYKDWSRHRIVKMDAVTAARRTAGMHTKNFGLLSAWPCYNEDWCYRAVSLLKPGQRFGYIGEGSGGCTGDDALHDLLASDFDTIAGHSVHRFLGINDHCWIYRRKS